MRFKCPECGTPLKAEKEKAGKKGRCPGCKTIVTVPQQIRTASQIPTQGFPEPPPLPVPDHTFEVIQETGKKERWQLYLYNDRLIIHSLEADTILEVLRKDVIEKIKTAKLFFIIHVLVVKDFKKFTFRIKPNEYDIINEWIGMPLLLKMTLKQRLSWCFPIGMIYMLTSLPLPGDPSDNLEAIPFDPVGMGLGIMLIVLSVFMKKKPTPALFLADSVWFFLLLCYTLYQVFSGASIYWGILILLYIMLIVSGINHYKNFSDALAV